MSCEWDFENIRPAVKAVVSRTSSAMKNARSVAENVQRSDFLFACTFQNDSYDINMRPPWQAYHPSWFCSRLWRYSTNNPTVFQTHHNFTSLTSYARCISPMLPNSVDTNQLVLGVDRLHLTVQRQIGRNNDGLSYANRERMFSSSANARQVYDRSSSSSLNDAEFDAAEEEPSLDMPKKHVRNHHGMQDMTDDCSLQILSDNFHLLRSWKEVNSIQSSEYVQQFSLMSYNILSQKLLEDNNYLYRHCNSDILPWEYRREKLFQELINSGVDILCLQEVQEDHYLNDFQAYFEKQGFGSLYKKRTGDKSDGCAIFYRTSSFELVEWIGVEFYRPQVHMLDRDNIGIVALFRPTKSSDTSSRVCVATTHLLFNPKRGDVKLAQLQVLLAEIENLAYKRTSSSGKIYYHPVILCGDMNSEPHCQIYNFVSTGMLNYAGLPIATMSGQKEDEWSRNCRCLSTRFLPPWLGITNRCQYVHRAAAHRQSEADEPDDSEREKGTLNQRPKSDAVGTNPSRDYGGASKYCRYNYSDEDLSLFSSGYMFHQFNLLSVYKHELERDHRAKEVTTQHSRASCTVDYIFYSVKKKMSHVDDDSKVVHKNVREDDLKLLGYCELLSEREVRCFGGLPNAICPSDHLPLIAKFALKL